MSRAVFMAAINGTGWSFSVVEGEACVIDARWSFLAFFGTDFKDGNLILVLKYCTAVVSIRPVL